LADALRDRSELTGIEREYEPNQPGFDVRLDRAHAAEIGVDARQAAEAIQAFFASAEVGEFIERDRQYTVLLEAADRASDAPEDLRQVWVRAGSGDLVPLDGLVDVTERASVRAYNRFNRQPVVEVSATLGDGADLSAGIEAVREEADALPAGAAIAWDGQARQYLEASGGAAVTFGIALLLVFLVLAAQFESFLLPVVILLSTPLAAAGALLALWVAGLPSRSTPRSGWCC
jgi:multidrug efflux pump